MYKEFLENNFYKVALSVAVISACFIGCYKTNNEPNLSFSDEFEIGPDILDLSEKQNIKCCKACGEKLEETEEFDMCEPCREVNNIIDSSDENFTGDYERSFSPSLSRSQEYNK